MRWLYPAVGETEVGVAQPVRVHRDDGFAGAGVGDVQGAFDQRLTGGVQEPGSCFDGHVIAPQRERTFVRLPNVRSFA